MDENAREPVDFESIYAGASDDLDSIPWAGLAPHPALVAWLDESSRAPSDAVVVGCGLGDDAEELARRGYRVTAFDLSPTAIGRCRSRFPDSPVDYRVTDVFALPSRWHHAFDTVVEIRTLQSVPPATVPTAAAAIATLVADGGELFVHCLARADQESWTGPPWPLAKADLAAFTRAGLDEGRLLDAPEESGPGQKFTVVYTRPGGQDPGA